MQVRFDEVCLAIKNLPKDGPQPMSDAERLNMYALFKQANIGDCNTDRPGMLDFTGKAKWDAWKGIEGMDKETAMGEYVVLYEKYNK